MNKMKILIHLNGIINSFIYFKQKISNNNNYK